MGRQKRIVCNCLLYSSNNNYIGLLNAYFFYSYAEVETKSVGHDPPNSSSGCEELNMNHSKIMLEDVELEEKVVENAEITTKKRKLGREQGPAALAKICENVKLKKKNVEDVKASKEKRIFSCESVGRDHPNNSFGCDELNVNHSEIILEDVELKEKVFDNVETATKKRKLGREQSPEASAKICENVKLKKKNDGDVKASKEKRIFSCDKCPASFPVKNSLIIHMRNHTGDKPYICQTCGKQFKAPMSLGQHMYVHTTGRQFPCDVCGKYYKRESDFRNHVKKYHELFKCNDCNKMFVTEKNLVEHRSKHTGEKPYSCTHCSKKFVSAKFFKRHVLKHEIVTKNFMKNCDETFTSKTVEETQNVSTENKLDLVSTCGKHFDQTKDSEGPVEIQLGGGGEKPYICNQCDNQYPDVQSFYRHINRHISSLKRYTCENCHRTFKYKSRYEDHICKETYACTQCDESFKFFRQLERHKIEIHSHPIASKSLSRDVVVESLSCDDASSNSKPDDCRLESVVKRFVCNQCGELFCLKIELISHLKIHNDENLRHFRKHKSCIKLKRLEDSVLKSKSKIHTETETHLEDSMLHSKSKIHTEMEMHYCVACDIEFSTYSEAQHHDHKIHKKLYSVCNLCNRVFKQDVFTLHYMKYHVNKNYLRCTCCSRQFTEFHSFYRHMNKLHGCLDKHYCNVCNKLFATKSDLEQHHMVHRDSKPFLCEICCDTFLLESDLIAHKMSYSEKMLSRGSEIGGVQRAGVHKGPNIVGANVLHGYNISTTKQRPNKDLFRREGLIGSSVASQVYMEPNGMHSKVQQARKRSMSKKNFSGRHSSGTNQQSSLFFENDSTIFGSSSHFQRANSILVDPAIESSYVAGRVDPRTYQIHKNFPNSSKFSSKCEKISDHISNEDNFDSHLSVEIEIGDVFTKDKHGQNEMDDHRARRELHFCCSVCFKRFPTDVELNWHLNLHSKEIIVVKPESDQYNNPSGLGPTNEHTVVTHDASACSKEKIERSNVSESGGTLVCRNGTLSMPRLQDSSIGNESFNYCISESELLLKKEHETFQSNDGELQSNKHEPFVPVHSNDGELQSKKHEPFVPIHSNDGELQSKKHEPFVPVHTSDYELQWKTGYELIRPPNSCNGDIQPYREPNSKQMKL